MAWVVAFAVVGLLIAVSAMLFPRSERTSRNPLPLLWSVPDFRFTTQEGKILTRADLLGKVWIADFLFTRCLGPCPAMTSKMAEISRELTKGNDVRLVSVSIDPEHDTPTVLTEYATRFQADPQRWIFLTGPKKEIETFTTQGMLQALATDSTGIPTHSTRFLVIDRDGEVRKIRDLDEPELVQKLLIDMGGLLRESSPLKASSATP